MKALGYVTRLEGHSPRRQQNDIRSRFASVYRIHWFAESGLHDGSPKPKLAELVGSAVAESPKPVLVVNLKCFADCPGLRAAITGVVRGFGLTIESVHHEPLAEQGLADAVCGMVSEILDVLKARGLLVSRSTRRRPGPKPYGQARDAALANRERQVRDEILRLKGEGWGVARIAKKLNAAGERTRRGSLWYSQSVARVLAAES